MSDTYNSLDKEIDLRELLAAFWAQKILILLIIVISIFLSGYKALTIEKKFVASAFFQIDEQNNNGINLRSDIGALASLAGFSGAENSSLGQLLERVKKREFILDASNKIALEGDPYFNVYNPSYVDPFWKSVIKKIIGWQKTIVNENAAIEKAIISSYQELVEIEETEGGSISISVTHNDPQKAAYYANAFMEEIRKLVQKESSAAQNLRLSYLSETLADALQDVETAQQNLKDYALENSALAQENFISGSLKLDQIRMERRKVEEISNLLSIVEKLVKSGNLDSGSYEALRESYPLVDDLDFRRILGMSETISAWTWPEIETIEAVSATLRDRIKRLDVEIKNIEDNAKIYATSAENLAKYTRDAKIAEATYTVLIEQVKSQSLAAGFKPNTFKVFEYATPPLAPTWPKRNLIIVLGAILGLLISFFVALIISISRGVYYSRGTLISETNAKLSLNSKSIKRLSRKPISKIGSFLSIAKVLQVSEAEIKLANSELIYVLNCGGRVSASGTARVLATQSSQSGRKIVLCDTSGHSYAELKDKSELQLAGLPIVSFENNLSVIKGTKGVSFITSPKFSSTLKSLLKNFDQVYICSSNDDATLGLMALQEFTPSLVLMAGIRKTKKSEIKKIITNQPVDILFYD